MDLQPTTGQLNYLEPNVLTATVSNAPAPDLQWQLTCQAGQGSQCGTLTLFNGSHTDETTVWQYTYLPPNVGVYTVTITATLVDDPSKTASVTITRGYPTFMTFSSIPTSLPVGSTASISAFVSADPLMGYESVRNGYTWRVTCGSNDCGTFSNASPIDWGEFGFTSNRTAAWGIPSTIQYNAPATIPSGGMVTITVWSGSDGSLNPSSLVATSTITITP